MLDNIPNWKSNTPTQLSILLRKKAFPKQSIEVIEETVIEYFTYLHSQKKRKLFNIIIGDKLSLLASFAEIFSIDPISLLLKWGLVVFDDCICLNIERLCQIMNFSVHFCIESLKKSQYFQLNSLPQECYQTLFQLGFIDSPEFTIFTISQVDPFYLYIKRYPFIIQPFPLEVTDILLLAKQELRNAENEKLRLQLQSAEKRLELQFSLFDKTPKPISIQNQSDDYDYDEEEEDISENS